MKDREIKAFIEAQTTQQHPTKTSLGHKIMHIICPCPTNVGCQTIHQGACVASEFHLKVRFSSLLPKTEAVKHIMLHLIT